MNIISVPTTPQAIAPLLKHDEEIICTSAIVTVDSKGVVTWWDKNKMINIICKEGNN